MEVDGGPYNRVHLPPERRFLNFRNAANGNGTWTMFRRCFENPDNPGLMGALFPENALSLISAKN